MCIGWRQASPIIPQAKTGLIRTMNCFCAQAVRDWTWDLTDDDQIRQSRLDAANSLSQPLDSRVAHPKQESFSGFLFRTTFPWAHISGTTPAQLKIIRFVHSLTFSFSKPFRTSNDLGGCRHSMSNTYSAAIGLNTRVCPKVWSAVSPTTPWGRVKHSHFSVISHQPGLAISPTLQPFN